MVARDSGKGVGELVFNENRISVWEDENVLELPTHYSSMMPAQQWWTYLMPWNWKLKNGEMINFMLHINFTTTIKNKNKTMSQRRTRTFGLSGPKYQLCHSSETLGYRTCDRGVTCSATIVYWFDCFIFRIWVCCLLFPGKNTGQRFVTLLRNSAGSNGRELVSVAFWISMA